MIPYFVAYFFLARCFFEAKYFLYKLVVIRSVQINFFGTRSASCGHSFIFAEKQLIKLVQWKDT